MNTRACVCVVALIDGQNQTILYIIHLFQFVLYAIKKKKKVTIKKIQIQINIKCLHDDDYSNNNNISADHLMRCT